MKKKIERVLPLFGWGLIICGSWGIVRTICLHIDRLEARVQILEAKSEAERTLPDWVHCDATATPAETPTPRPNITSGVGRINGIGTLKGVE